MQAKDTAEEFHAANFSAFVASQHAEFRSRIGDGKKVNWTTGKGADGNDDVADLIGATRGGRLRRAELRRGPQAGGRRRQEPRRQVRHPQLGHRRDGRPGPRRVEPINDFQVSPAASDAYPISSYTFLVVFQRQFDTAKGATLLRLLRYMTGEGQASAVDLHYAPLPPPPRKLITAKPQLLTGPDGTPLT